MFDIRLLIKFVIVMKERNHGFLNFGHSVVSGQLLIINRWCGECTAHGVLMLEQIENREMREYISLLY